MTPLRILLSSSMALAMVSCATNKDDYDTANPYGTADYGAPYQPVEPVNPTYDTPAAYEDSSAPASPNLPAEPSYTPAPSSPASGGGTATVHTVVRGDTLWGLSRKYSVSVDAIKRANGMSSDTVVLGSRLQIPAR